MASKIGDRLRKVREGEQASIDLMADKMDVNKNTLGAYERGERLPDIDYLITFSDKTGDDFLKLLELRLQDSEAPGASTAVAIMNSIADVLEELPVMHRVREPDAPYSDGFVFIDKYVDVRGSAGPGTEVYEEAVVKVRMDARLLRERIGNNFSRIKIASVSGDSMEPTLSHGDQVLIDTSCDRFRDDAIYAIQQDGYLRFKRIQLKLDGSIVVCSDGSPNIETYSAEVAAGFFVIGVVIPFKFGRFKV
jgi:phage repressor protein C with HTH and peptisase S24 domain/DNA-binding XRE family transcriptional regulator